jgi:hypothetical protein
MYPTHDTDWALSAKGNYWRRYEGKLLVVGTKFGDFYWARIDTDFMDEQFFTLEEAQDAADAEVGAKPWRELT